MNNSYNFWRLIQTYKIEIPTIQRDYTYARKSTESIRKSLVSKILQSAKSKSSLHLDFIYGKLRGKDNLEMLARNKSNIETLLESLSSYAKTMNLEVDTSTKITHSEPSDIVTFIPLDGQQRLTTLFLIHWYLAYKTYKSFDVFKILSRFTYKTRVSSKDFLSLITSEGFVDKSNDRKKGIRDSIELNELFFTSWQKDPTVNGCLVVLEEIEDNLLDNSIKELEDLWDNLTNLEELIVDFDFFDLDNFELTDELYVKMNARGKRLTDFENFKAWLIKNYSSSKLITVSEWQKKLDIEWNDIFWKNRSPYETEIDETFLRFFKQFYLGEYVKTFFNEEKESGNYSKKYEEILFGDSNGLPIEIFESIDNYDSYLNQSFLFLDYQNRFLGGDNSFNEAFFRGDLDSLFFSSERLNWWHASLFYAISRYIIKFPSASQDHFLQWLRIVSNLIYNTPIESARLYKNTIKSIDNLLSSIKINQSVYESLIKLEEIDFFDNEQCQEEILKASYCLSENGNEWEELFKQLEYVKYFHGQIGFVFNLLSSDISPSEFKKRADILKVLFDEEVIQRKDYLLFRSLCRLTDVIENVFLKKSLNLFYPLLDSSGTLRRRNENWRRYFTGEKFFLFKELIDELLQYNVGINKKVIVNYLNNKIKISRSKNDFIDTILRIPKVLEYPKNNEIRPVGKTFYLFIRSRIYGWYREFYTYAASIEYNLEHRHNKNESNLLNTGIVINDDTFVYMDYNDGYFKVKGREHIRSVQFSEILKLIGND